MKITPKKTRSKEGVDMWPLVVISFYAGVFFGIIITALMKAGCENDVD